MKFIQDTKYNIRKTVSRIQNTIYKIRYTKSSIAFLTLGVIIAAIAISTFLLKSDGAAAWYSDNWSYRKKLTVDSSQVTGDHTDFPVLVSLTSDANLSAGAQADGDDIFFTDIGGNKLDHEIESYATGTLVAWVRIPQLSGSVDTDIFMYYGNASASSQENATGVWGSDYAGVWHLGEDTTDEATSATHADSTSNGNDGTQSGNVDTTGKIGTAQDFDGSNDYIDAGNGSSILNLNSGMTYSAWIRLDALGSPTEVPIISATGESPGAGSSLYIYTPGARLNYKVDYYGSGSTDVIRQSVNNTVTIDEWMYVAVIWDGGTNMTDIRTYKNGQEVSYLGGSNGGTGTRSNEISLIIGNYVAGVIDEVKVSSTARSADWIATEYANQNAPTTFLTAAHQETRTRGPAAYWTLNEGTGTTVSDSSGNGNVGSLGTGSSAPTWRTEESCISGKCLLFDGTNDYVTAPGNQSTRYTISMWIRPSDVTLEPIANMAETPGDVSKDRDLYIDNNGKIVARLYDGSARVARSTTSVTAGKWYYIVNSYDGTHLRVWINGVNEASTVAGNPYAAYTSPEYVIGYTNTVMNSDTLSNSFFNGFIDEVKIYPYARTAAEIKQDYQLGSVRGSSVSVGGGDQSFLSDGLVGYWDMEGIGTTGNGVSIPDKSGNGNTGTTDDGANNTGINCTTAGKYGGGCDFDGTDDYVVGSNETAFDMSNNSMSFTAWYKKDTSAAKNEVIIIKPESSSRGWEFNYTLGHYDGGQISCQFWVSGFTWVSAEYFPTLDTSWHHSGCIFDFSTKTVRLYYDGEEVDSTNWTTETPNVNNNNIQIGAAESDGGSSRFDGQIDEVRIYNRALSADEVKKLYAWAPGPVAYYNFDEGSGTSLSDRSGNENTGTLGGDGAGTDVPIWSQGKYGGALNYDGVDDRVTIPNSPEMEVGKSDFTFTWWLKTTSTSSGIFGKGSLSGSGDLRIYYSGTNILANWGIGTLMSVGTINDDTWHHFSFVVDRDVGGYMYVDGKLTATDLDYASIADVDITNGSSMLLGQATNRWTQGNLDEFKFYNYARTQSQILEDMNAGHPAVGTPVGSTVLHLSMDEGYGTTVNDKSPQGNNGTLGTGTSAPSWSNDGKFGKALDFDGTNDYVSVANDASVDFGTGDFVWSTWVKTTQNCTGNKVYMGRYEGSGVSAIWLGCVASGGIGVGRFDVRDNDNVSTAAQGTTQINDGAWHHVLGVKQGHSSATIQLYVDGVLDGTSTVTYTGDFDGAANINVGGNFATSGYFLDGMLDEVKIYPFALTAAQVATDYNQGKINVWGRSGTDSSGNSTSAYSGIYCPPGNTATCTAPVLEFNLEERSGSTAYDTSLSAYNGTLGSGSSAPTWSQGPGSADRGGAGGLGGALSFDGGDLVTLSTFTSYNYTNFTVSGWYKSADTTLGAPGTVEDEYIFSHKGTDQVILGITDDDDEVGKARLFIKDDTDQRRYYGTSVVNDGEWHFIAGVRDSANISIYVDGILETQTTDLDAGETIAVSSAAYLGNDILEPGPLHGTIDQVKLYGYARTPAQIAWDYSKGAPIAHWKFDECSGTTAKDATGNGNTGTITIGSNGENTVGDCGTSSTAWGSGASGKLNGSLSLDGNDDYVIATDNGKLNISGNYSLSAWVKSSTASQDGYAGIAVKTTDGTNIAYGLQRWNGGNISVVHASGSFDLGITVASVTDDQWHHILYTYSGTTVTGYLDGNQVIQGTYSTAQSTGTGALHMGTERTKTNNWNGQIDDVRIYNYALTAHQVRELYGGGAVSFR